MKTGCYEACERVEYQGHRRRQCRIIVQGNTREKPKHGQENPDNYVRLQKWEFCLNRR